MFTLNDIVRNLGRLTALLVACMACSLISTMEAQLIPIQVPPINIGTPPTQSAQSIFVSVTPAHVSLLVTGQQEFTAAVTNDLANAGVTWTVAPASGTVCSGVACGSVSPNSTASGTATAYQAPAIVPPGGAITVTATSVTDPTKSASATISLASGVNNAKLNGDYAFSFTGMMQSGGFIFAGIGRLSFDGAGNVTNGEIDINSTQYPGPAVPQQIMSGTYALGADNRGVMSWNIPANGPAGGTQPLAQLAFALKDDGNIAFSVWHPVIGRGEFGTGTMERSNATAYSTSQITGDYAFGTPGFDHSNNRAGFAGRLTADGAGNFSNVDAVLNTAGLVYETLVSTGSYAVSEASTGRGTLRIIAQVGAVPRTFNFAFYVVNAGKLFVLESDSYALATPLLNGTIMQQQTPAGGFSAASLNGNSVLYLAGGSTCPGATSAQPDVLAGLLRADGTGNVTLADDRNCGGTSTFTSSQSGTYTVISNGHSCVTVGSLELVGFLINGNQGFWLGTDSSALSGLTEMQTTTSANNSSVLGNYVGTTATLAPFAGNSWSGEFNADGGAPTGTFTGSKDVVDAVGPNAGVAFNATYSVSASPINGRGIISVGSGGSGGTIYVISTSRFVEIPSTDNYPAIFVFEK